MARKDEDAIILNELKKLSVEEHEKLDMLQKLGIYELRGLAREMGVSSPTTKRRAELIKFIIMASKGTKDVLKNNQGRPPKKMNKVSEIYNKFMNIDKVPKHYNLYDDDYARVVMFCQPIDVEEKQTDIFVRGIYRDSDNPYLYDFSSKKTVYIPSSLKYRDKLSTGQMLRGYANKEENKYILRKLESINSQPVEAYKKPSKIILEEVMPEKVFEANNLRFREGSIFRRVYSEYDYLDEVKNACKVINEISDKGYKVITLGINIGNDARYYIENNAHGEKFLSKYDDDPIVSFNKILDLVNYVKNLLIENKKVFIYIYDICSLISQLDMYFAEVGVIMNNHNSESVKVLKSILSLAKAYKCGASVTILSTYHKNESNDEIIINNILKISEAI